MRLLPDGTHALVRIEEPFADGGGQTRVQRISLKTGDPDGPELLVPGGLACIAFARDGKAVVGVTKKDSTARCWSFPDGKEVWSAPLSKQADRFAAAFSYDGRTVAVAASKSLDEYYTQRTPAFGPRGDRSEELLKLFDTDLGTGVSVFSSADGKRNRFLRTTTGERANETELSYDGRLVLINVTAVGYTREPGRKVADRQGNITSQPGPVSLHNRVLMRIYDTTAGVVVQEWPHRALVAFAPDRYVLAVAEELAGSAQRDANGVTRRARTGRLGFWHFDPAPPRK